MKVQVNIINTRCLFMSEAVTVPSSRMRTSTVSEESLVRDTHTQTGLSVLKFYDLKTKTKRKEKKQKVAALLALPLQLGSRLLCRWTYLQGGVSESILNVLGNALAQITSHLASLVLNTNR